MTSDRSKTRSDRRFSKKAGMVTAAALLLAGGVATGTAAASSHHSHGDQAGSASIAATVRNLADIQDIEKLKARYFQDVDTKQWADLQALFTPDAHINTGQEFNSPAELVKATKTLIADAPTAHQGLLPNITVKGDTATGTWVMEDYVNLKAGGGFHGYGQYHDTYKRIDGRWYITGSVLERYRMDTLPDTGPYRAAQKTN
ncbi:nuclear transport factor 2 family protein [Streptomyces sp. NPDC086777]|uniref:nuclear transport factor 2 family protein n=1 Tax=Streptomyces sp. NPDC086777 TaxID=3154866 RepID=UPI00344BD95C